MMRLRVAAISTAMLICSAVAVAGAGAAVIGIYRNDMESNAQRAQIAKLAGERCGKGDSEHAFKIVVGKRTDECTYRTPAIGRDLEIAAVGRLLQRTPKAVQRKAFLGLDLRAGEAGARYQLAAFPLQRKAQLRKVTADGRVEYLQIERGVETNGINRANELRLRAFNFTSGPEKGKCRVLAFVGGELIADVTDPAAGELEGRSSGFSLGAVGNATGAVGSFDEVVVRVPNPF
jgi:hypothetical protein